MKHILAVLLIFILTIPAFGWEGVVTRVVDGDTIHVKDTMNRDNIIRLYGIDAPEMRSPGLLGKWKPQPYSREAALTLTDLTLNKTVEVTPRSQDPYGRTVAEVAVGMVDVSAYMLSTGCAWYYKQFAKNRPTYALLELQAKQQQLGLWAQTNPVPPWEWRKK
jgi:micrococcal nuclease